MNFLGHLYLSGDNENIKLGNFIGDYVKGNKYLLYPDEVSMGIVIHRKIDHFTDTHPIVKEVSVLFKPNYGRYSGVVVDLFFDHLLAKHWNDFSSWRLRDFTRNAHAVFLSNFWLLPGKVRQFLPFLIQSKRLESYATEDGIRKVLDLMSKYTSLPYSSDSAMEILVNEQDFLYHCFVDFMEDITDYIETNFDIAIQRNIRTVNLNKG